jgi:hypothetical protein
MARRKFSEFTKLVTPAGKFAFPKLQTPDVKFSADGEYSVGVELSGVTAEEFKEKIQEAYDREYKIECESHGKTLKKYENMPWAQTLDRDKNPVEGSTTFKCKRKASGQYGKAHAKAGQRWTAGFPIFSAAGTEKVTEEIWGGTIGRCSLILIPWYTAALGFGIRLQLEAVKVLELVTQGDKAPTQFGFEDEDGYAAAPSSATDPETSDGELGEEEGGGGTDF